MDATNLSLDDIIKKKKIKTGTGFKGRKTIGSFKKQTNGSKPSGKVLDARMKIIQKNRSKIRDARDKLVQIAKKSDARLKILRKHKIAQTVAPLKTRKNFNARNKQQPPQFKETRNFIPREMKLTKKGPYIGAPRGYVDHDMMENEEITFPIELPSAPLRRTVHNDVMPMDVAQSHSRYSPSASGGGSGGFGRSRSPQLWHTAPGGDPFDIYEVPSRRPSDNYPVESSSYLTRQVRNMSPDLMSPKKGILRRSMDSPPSSSHMRSLQRERRYIPDENSHLSYEMRTRLERAPDLHASMGIFSNSPPHSPPPQSPNGYRIVVSNLHSSVTQNDIKELFEDIGQLLEARLVRPGVAEVIFKTLKDAEEAVETYHNRQLDGLPMKCLLVNPRSSGKPTAPALKSSSASMSSSRIQPKKSIEIDIDALHTVLFRRH